MKAIESANRHIKFVTISEADVDQHRRNLDGPEKSMPSRPHRVAILIVLMGLYSACTRPPVDDAATSPGSQKLPFDRQPRESGISPSQALIPYATRLPEGTSISVRLQNSLSSGTSHTGDTFGAILVQPLEVDGATLVAKGSSAAGRVLEAKPASSAGGLPEDGYLRLVLVSLNVGGHNVTIETSSIFAKGGAREGRRPAAGTKPKSDRTEYRPPMLGFPKTSARTTRT